MSDVVAKKKKKRGQRNRSTSRDGIPVCPLLLQMASMFSSWPSTRAVVHAITSCPYQMTWSGRHLFSRYIVHTTPMLSLNLARLGFPKQASAKNRGSNKPTVDSQVSRFQDDPPAPLTPRIHRGSAAGSRFGCGWPWLAGLGSLALFFARGVLPAPSAQLPGSDRRGMLGEDQGSTSIPVTFPRVSIFRPQGLVI